MFPTADSVSLRFNPFGGSRHESAQIVNAHWQTGNPAEAPVHGGLQRVDLLDQAACNRVVDSVLALRDHWLPRVPLVPFFTLGAASYIDAIGERTHYEALARTYNPILHRHFDWLLERVREAIAGTEGMETVWLEGSALPGFHIYLANNLFSLPVASVHCDRQYQLVDWSAVENPDFTSPLSFTLPIQLPRSGGGLNTWNVREDEIEAVKKSAAKVPRVFEPYRVGELVMHSGNLLHQIAPSREMEEDDRRITLQGHGIRAGKRLFLYW
jgi:hypothetical protein